MYIPKSKGKRGVWMYISKSKGELGVGLYITHNKIERGVGVYISNNYQNKIWDELMRTTLVILNQLLLKSKQITCCFLF